MESGVLEGSRAYGGAASMRRPRSCRLTNRSASPSGPDAHGRGHRVVVPPGMIDPPAKLCAGRHHQFLAHSGRCPRPLSSASPARRISSVGHAGRGFARTGRVWNGSFGCLVKLALRVSLAGKPQQSWVFWPRERGSGPRRRMTSGPCPSKNVCRQRCGRKEELRHHPAVSSDARLGHVPPPTLEMPDDVGPPAGVRGRGRPSTTLLWRLAENRGRLQGNAGVQRPALLDRGHHPRGLAEHFVLLMEKRHSGPGPAGCPIRPP